MFRPRRSDSDYHLQTMVGLSLAKSKHALRCFSFLAASAMESLDAVEAGTVVVTELDCCSGAVVTAGTVWTVGET